MEIQINEKKYRTGRMDARRQFHVVRRLAPILSGLTDLKKMMGEPLAALGPLADAVASMSDQDADYVINSCLSCVERQQSAGGWAKVMVDDALMFQDLDMAAMLRLTWAVLQENLQGFFDALPSGLSAALRKEA